ncbi:MAG: AAA family ATPase [Elusimicrobiota bacterium]
MISTRLIQSLKSTLAIILCASLAVTSCVLPAAAQIRQGGAPAARVGVPLVVGAPGSLMSAPGLGLSVRPAAPFGAAVLPAPLPVVLAAQPPASQPKPGAEPQKKKKSGAPKKEVGPRWVDAIIENDIESAVEDGEDGGKRLFDGGRAAQGEITDVSASPSPAQEREAVINDLSLPTPKAVALTARIDGKRAAPRWVRTVAPVAALGAAAALFSANVVPALIISASLMFSILAHETAHVLGLRIWGDPTPKLAGRDSINPLDHISMLGTVIVPAASVLASMSALGFPVVLGWAKPIPVDFNNLKNPQKDAAKVTVLGPLTNLALAAAAGAVYLAFPAAGLLSTAALTLFKMNAALAVFNLIPLPQLDGGKVLVSLLPKSLYARWTHDPNLPMGYQSLYRRIYEGPANLLTRLHIHDFGQVNALTRAVSLAALGAFYAAFFSVLSVPLLFLALPCSYDYWCIRQKVRSEAAVQDLMKIMSQWSAVILQIVDDLGSQVNSEVSAYETEHAMKNALESLVDEMMAKSDFQALTDGQKLDAFMKEYPEKAARSLKEKAMSEDSLETIRMVLGDPRNAESFARLRKWFTEQEIFSQWKDPHNKEKLKDSLEEASRKTKADGERGGALLPAIAILGVGAAAALFSQAVAPVSALLAGLGLFAMIGDLGGPLVSAPDLSYLMKIRRGRWDAPNVILVHLPRSVSAQDLGRLTSGLEQEGDGVPNGGIVSFSFRVPDMTQIDEIIRRIASDPVTIAVEAQADVYRDYLAPDEATRRKLTMRVTNISTGVQPLSLWVRFDRSTTLERIGPLFLGLGITNASHTNDGGNDGDSGFWVHAVVGTQEQAGLLAQALAADSRVQEVELAESALLQIDKRYRSGSRESSRQNPSRARPPVENNPLHVRAPTRETLSKLIRENWSDGSEVRVSVVLYPGAHAGDLFNRLGINATLSDGKYSFLASSLERAARDALALIAEPLVNTVRLSERAFAKIAEIAPGAGQAGPAAGLLSAREAAAKLLPIINTPAFDDNTLLIHFDPMVSYADSNAMLMNLGLNVDSYRPLSTGYRYWVQTLSAGQAAAAARALVDSPNVKYVELSESVRARVVPEGTAPRPFVSRKAALRKLRLRPEGSSLGYRDMWVFFKEGVTADQARAIMAELSLSSNAEFPNRQYQVTASDLDLLGAARTALHLAAYDVVDRVEFGEETLHRIMSNFPDAHAALSEAVLTPWIDKVRSSSSSGRGSILAVMRDDASGQQLYSSLTENHQKFRQGRVVSWTMPNSAEAAAQVLYLADNEALESVTVAPETEMTLRSLWSQTLAPAPVPATLEQIRSKVSATRESEPTPGAIWVRFQWEIDLQSATALFSRLGLPRSAYVEQAAGFSLKAQLPSEARAAEAASALAAESGVVSVDVNPAAYNILLANAAPVAWALRDKIKASATQPDLSLSVKFEEGMTQAAVESLIQRYYPAGGELASSQVLGRLGMLMARTEQAAANLATRLAAESGVVEVRVSATVRDLIQPAAAAPVPAASDRIRSKVSLTHEPESAPGAIWARFQGGMDLQAATAVLSRLGLTRINYHRRVLGQGFSLKVQLPTAARAVEAALSLATESGVEEVLVSATVRDLIQPPATAPPGASSAPQESASQPAQEEPAAPSRRDPFKAWVEHLQNAVLKDGKSKLTAEQVQGLSKVLEPVALSPGETRPPVVSRVEQVKKMMTIVTSPVGMRNSVVLIGEAGVGKTAVVEGLAEMIEEAEYASAADDKSFLDFERLKGRWLVKLNIESVLSSQDPVSSLTALFSLLPQLNSGPASRGNDVIVLMDDIQKFFLDANGRKIANSILDPLAKGKITLIAATTLDHYKNFIEKDDGFRRRLQPIEVKETDVAQTISLLRARKTWMQILHNAVIEDSVLVAAATLTDQFDKINFNPDKSVKAIQDSAELSRPENLRATIALDLREVWGSLVVAVNEARQTLIDKGVASILTLPVEHYNKIAELVSKAEQLYKERDAITPGLGQVTTNVVKRVIASNTGIASGQLNLGEEDSSRYVNMEAEISKRVVNQLPAISAIANAVRRNKAGLSNGVSPMGKFLFVGPTGVGKTYLAKELARFLFNDPEAMTRFDMSEYMEKHTVARMTGAPPGYVGYEAGGQLTEAVRKRPYSVLLFDEIEKAHGDVFNLLLQVLDDGRLTDGQGRTVDFSNTVIVMTSNSGMANIDGEKYARLLKAAADHNERVKINQAWDADIQETVGQALKARFRPEFLNRLDEDPLSKNKWVTVNRLGAEHMEQIARIQLGEFQKRLLDRHETDIQFDQSLIGFLAEEGYSPLYGARPMASAIEKHIVNPLAVWILKEAESGKKDVRGGLIQVAYKDGKVVFHASPKPETNIPRATVQGASETVAAAVFKMIERLAQDGEGEQPGETVFDLWMRKARPEAASTGAPALKRERVAVLFAPDQALRVDAARIALEHNKPSKKDAAAREQFAKILAAAEAAAWPKEMLEPLEAPKGPGSGWLKEMTRLSKELAGKAGASAPVEIGWSVDADSIKISLEGSYDMPAADLAWLSAHFSGAAPQSFDQAQQKADSLNAGGNMVWDHTLLDLYRRLSALPGARMGAAVKDGRTQIWLEIKKQPPAAAAAQTAAAPAASAQSAASSAGLAQTQELLMRFIDQSRLSELDRDGQAIPIAAAEAYAMIAQPSQAAVARGWLRDKGWDRPLAPGRDVVGAAVGAHWPLAMTAALVLERFGDSEADAALLETLSRRVRERSHYEAPLHGALVQALSVVYGRLGELAVLRVRERVDAMFPTERADIVSALNRAAGHVATGAAEQDAAIQDAQGYLALMRRRGREDELLQIFQSADKWESATEKKLIPAVKLAALTQSGPQALSRIEALMRKYRSYSELAYEIARAWAGVVARDGRTQGLGQVIRDYLAANGVQRHTGTWAALLAYVETARLGGGEDVLGALEALMQEPPQTISALHEQAYFTAPDAWARTLVRNGKFEEYARPQGTDAQGAALPSKLQDMLASQSSPMLAAAALRAIGYARAEKKPLAAAPPTSPTPAIAEP